MWHHILFSTFENEQSRAATTRKGYISNCTEQAAIQRQLLYECDTLKQVRLPTYGIRWDMRLKK